MGDSMANSKGYISNTKNDIVLELMDITGLNYQEVEYQVFCHENDVCDMTDAERVAHVSQVFIPLWPAMRFTKCVICHRIMDVR